MAVTAGLSVLTVLIAADAPWSRGWVAGLLSLVNTTLFLTTILWSRSIALARLFVFGLTLGMMELIADALCVRFTGTLDYSIAHSPPIGLSPWWMPLAWMMVSAQIGFLGAFLIEQWGFVRGAAMTAFVGAVGLPFYEQMAFRTHWWQYRHCRMIGHAPVYIIVAELCIGFCLAPLARHALHGPTMKHAFFAGFLGGAATIVGGLIGFGLIEPRSAMAGLVTEASLSRTIRLAASSISRRTPVGAFPSSSRTVSVFLPASIQHSGR